MTNKDQKKSQSVEIGKDEEPWTAIDVEIPDEDFVRIAHAAHTSCLLYTSPSPRDLSTSRMPSSA